MGRIWRSRVKDPQGSRTRPALQAADSFLRLGKLNAALHGKTQDGGVKPPLQGKLKPGHHTS